MIRMSGALARSRSCANCDLSSALEARMFSNRPHYYRKFDLAVFVVNGVPRVQESPGGKLTSIGDLQVRYFQPGGVPVES